MWQLLTIAGRQSVALLVFTTLARLLDPSSFGQVAMVGVYLYLVSMLANLGLTTALVQKDNLTPEHIDSAFWANLLFNSALSGATILFSESIAALLGDRQLSDILKWSSLSLVISAASSVHGTLFVKEMSFRQPALRTLIASSLGGVIGVSMAYTDCGVWSLVGQQLSTALAGSLFLWLYSSYRPTFTFSIAHLRELLGVGLTVFSNTLIWFVTSRVDQLVIGRVAGTLELGLYSIAGKLPELAKSSTQQPLIDVLVPGLSSLQNDLPRMRESIYKGSELNAAIMFPVFVGIAAVSNDLVHVLFGEKWLLAAPSCALLSIYALSHTLQVFFYPALLASGVTGKQVALSLVQASGVVIACFIGIRFGVQELIIGLIANSLLMIAPTSLLLRSRIGLDPLRYFRPCIQPFIAVAAMVSCILLFRKFVPIAIPQMRLVVDVAIGAATYCMVLHQLRPSLFLSITNLVTRRTA